MNQANTVGHKTYGYPEYLREDGSFIGLGIIDVACKNEFGGCGEIGYLLLQYWGRGYATEMADTLLKIGFSVLQLHRIYARCNKNNKASEKVMKNTGMQKEGELRKAKFKHGGWHNELVYALLAEKYRPKQQ